MKTRTHLALIALSALCLSCGKSADRASIVDESGKKTAIERVLQDYVRVVNELDLELAESIWSQSAPVSFIHPRGHQRGWAEVRTDFYEGAMGGLPTRELKFQDTDIALLDNDNAWAEIYWTFAATTPFGKELNTAGRETMILAREGGKWRIRHVHYSGMPVTGEGEGF